MDFWYVLVYLSNNRSTPNTGKILIIGGSIANFTNVAATFKVTSHGTVQFLGKVDLGEAKKGGFRKQGLRQKQVLMTYPAQ